MGSGKHIKEGIMFAKCRCGKKGPLYGQTVKAVTDGEQISGRCSSCGREITIFVPFEKPAAELEPFPPFPEPVEDPAAAPVEAVALVEEPTRDLEPSPTKPEPTKIRRLKKKPKW